MHPRDDAENAIHVGDANPGWKTITNTNISKHHNPGRQEINRKNENTDEAQPSEKERTNDRKELTEEELELLREKRRQRRKREKEARKRVKEEKIRADIYAPKSSKINVVSDSILQG